MAATRRNLYPPKGKTPHRPGEPRNVLPRINQCPGCHQKYHGKRCLYCAGEQEPEDQEQQEAEA
jgi:hypothetical protein